MPRRKLITKRQEAAMLRAAERRAEQEQLVWGWRWWRPGQPFPGSPEAKARSRAYVAGVLGQPEREEPLP